MRCSSGIGHAKASIRSPLNTIHSGRTQKPGSDHRKKDHRQHRQIQVTPDHQQGQRTRSPQCRSMQEPTESTSPGPSQRRILSPSRDRIRERIRAIRRGPRDDTQQSAKPQQAPQTHQEAALTCETAQVYEGCTGNLQQPTEVCIPLPLQEGVCVRQLQ